MDLNSIFQMLIPVGINIIGGFLSSLLAGGAPNVTGWKKQFLVIGLCLGASVGNMYITGSFSGVSLDFTTTEGTFGSISALLVLMASAWTASQAFYFKVIKKD